MTATPSTRERCVPVPRRVDPRRDRQTHSTADNSGLDREAPTVAGPRRKPMRSERTRSDASRWCYERSIQFCRPAPPQTVVGIPDTSWLPLIPTLHPRKGCGTQNVFQSFANNQGRRHRREWVDAGYRFGAIHRLASVATGSFWTHFHYVRRYACSFSFSVSRARWIIDFVAETEQSSTAAIPS